MTNNVVTTYYYHGGALVALRKGTALEYVHQDHLSGTSVSTDSVGATKSSLKYLPFGETLTGTGALGTDREFTGQRLDGTGLYFYNARYYDPTIGRFVSADTIVPSILNPQALNRYSYVGNNPLTYDDPTGNCFGPFKRACKKAKNLIVDGAKGAKNVATKAGQNLVDAAAAATAAYAEAREQVTNTLAPVLNPVAKPLEIAINSVTVPTANFFFDTGINEVKLNPAQGSVEVKVSEDGLLAKALGNLPGGPPGGAAGITIPINPVPLSLLSSLVVVREEAGSLPVLEKHEEAHVYQQQFLGPLFIPFYFIGSGLFGYNNNPFEVQAGDFAQRAAPRPSQSEASASPDFFDLVYGSIP